MKTICKVYADRATCGRRQQITSTHQEEAEGCRIGRDEFFLRSAEQVKFFLDKGA